MKGWIAPALITGMLVAAPRAEADVRLVIADGHVSLDAKDATVRQILDEWARVGHTRIVNSERITGAPLTLQLTNVPEAEALDILLRSVSGYMAAPRATAVPNASRFDRILVMPTSVAPRVTAAAAPMAPPAAFQPPPMPNDDLQIDEPPMPAPGGVPGNANQRGPVMFPPQYPNPNAPGGQFPNGATGQFPSGATGQFPGNPRGGAPTPFPPGFQGGTPTQGDAAPVNVPGVMPVGVSTPGMVVAPPSQPGQPVPPPDNQR